MKVDAVSADGKLVGLDTEGPFSVSGCSAVVRGLRSAVSRDCFTDTAFGSVCVASTAGWIVGDGLNLAAPTRTLRRQPLNVIVLARTGTGQNRNGAPVSWSRVTQRLRETW